MFEFDVAHLAYALLADAALRCFIFGVELIWRYYRRKVG
jgi:hypothetical protein